MRTSIRRVAVVVTCWILLWACAAHGHDNITDVSGLIAPELRLPHGHQIRHSLFAVGHQIYTYNGTAWVQANVSADLFDFRGNKLGFHYLLGVADENGGRATWETTHPWPSRVTAKPIASEVQEGSIPLLLLEVTSREGHKRLLGAITYIQRLFTHGGLPPSSEEPAKLGDVFESYYTSLYTYALQLKGSHR